MKHGIVWLASYPRSGNTWLRAFLTNYWRNAAEPASIDELLGGPIAADRASFDVALGYSSGGLSDDETDFLRPPVYLNVAQTASKVLLRKVHDAYRYLPDGRPLFPPEASLGVVYIVRNPLDVCASLADFSGESGRDKTVSFLSSPGASLSGDGSPKFRQILSSWSMHVSSWLAAPGHRVTVIRYEDMKRFPEQCFSGVVRFLGWPESPHRLQKALEFSHFSALQNQEKKYGFLEGSSSTTAFFRQGEIGTWQGALSLGQSTEIIARHRAIMTQFGYLDESGRPVF